MLLSIIIPMYNAAPYIGRCIDSILSNSLNTEDYEIICIDDNAPDKRQNEIVKEYAKRFPNIQLIIHNINKRQGGARNTGVENANGDFIAYIDQDDTFKESSLKELIQALKENSYLDILMTTAATINEKGDVKTMGYENKNSSDILSGSEFINKNEVPWCPWCYIYKKDFLKSINLRFVENVRFEDMDYVMHATLAANKMRFLPVDLIRYHISSEQTTFFGNDFNRIHDWINMTDRVQTVSEKYMDKDPNGANAVRNHYIFSYTAFLKRYCWRLKYSEINQLLSAYPPRFGNSLIINISRKPNLYASLAAILKPSLNLAWKIKRLLRRIR